MQVTRPTVDACARCRIAILRKGAHLTARFVTIGDVLKQSRLDLEREAELRAYAVLGEDDIPALERIADLAAALSGMSVAEVNVVSTTDVVHVATTNRDHLRVPREQSFCSTVITYDVDTYVVPDATQEQPFASSPYVTGELAAIRSYVGARLVAPSGTVLGTLCVFDQAFVEVSDEHLASLTSLAAMVVEVLEMRRTQVDLAGTLTRLADSHRELHVSNESLEAFAGQISHDLQAPLTAVEIALELLEDETELAEEALVLLEHARSGGRRMQRTITDLLDFAVLGAGSPAVRVELTALVEETLVDLSSGLVGAKIDVGPLPAVLGHESEIRAVLQNLVANAVKFAASSGVPQVQISGVARGASVRITVADNGPGVPESERDKVFNLAFRGNTEIEGHGIGLATCARIVQARGGRIGVDQAASGGAAFWFELPAAP